MGTYHYYIQSKTHTVEIDGVPAEVAVFKYSHKPSWSERDAPKSIRLLLARNEAIWSRKKLPRYLVSENTWQAGKGVIYDLHTDRHGNRVHPWKVASHFDDGEDHVIAGELLSGGRKATGRLYTSFVVEVTEKPTVLFGQIQLLCEMMGEGSGFRHQERSRSNRDGRRDVLDTTLFLHCAEPAQQTICKLTFETMQSLREMQAAQPEPTCMGD